MARARIPGVGSGGVNRLKGAVAKTVAAKSKTGSKATFVGRKSKAKAKAKPRGGK
jgi:hypothetical protein